MSTAEDALESQRVIAEPAAVDQSFPSTTGVHQGQNGEQESEQNVTAENLISSLFYLKHERPERNTYSSNVGQVVHKSMHYKCVDSSGPNKFIQVDLLDIVEKVIGVNE